MNNLSQEKVRSIVQRAITECLPPPNAGSLTREEAIDLFHSPEALVLKNEIIDAGRKLWARAYVDGNGGNISARITPEYVISSPTLCSKGDLRLEDLSLVDLENNRICGDRKHTSEILLHLEIYKAVPQATAVIHCHPPYATAHAIAGVIPPGNLIPEMEVFVGPVAISPYDTPGTTSFARTVLPFVKQHNTILLANHGIVCWADTVTHAEWYTEVIDTYCKTVMIASQLGKPLKEIPPDKIADLLAIKKSLGLPDARFAADEEEKPLATAVKAAVTGSSNGRPAQADIDRLVASISTTITDFLDKHS